MTAPRVGRSHRWPNGRILVANENHLAVIRQQVTVWNQWREANIHLKPDLSGADLSEVSLCYADLRNTNLTNANLHEADLRFANLSGAILSKVNFRYANLSGTTLSGANLSGANLSGAQLSGANLSDATLNEADLSGANLNGAYLSEADLSNAYLRYATLSEVDLSEADLSRATLSGANFRDATLSNADLIQANLQEADFSGADLRGANFSLANLHQANLSNTNLSGAIFREANLQEADLIDANLTTANLSGATLQNADLATANLSGANLSDANFSKTNLSDANFSAVNAPGTTFNDATFTGACLADWTITNATTLEDVICDYFYLKNENGTFKERRPSSGTFAAGGFTALFQKPAESIQLLFKEGINWKAFSLAFQKLRRQTGYEQLSIQAIEQKRSGSLVVRLEIPPEIDKTVVEAQAHQIYDAQLSTLEAQYEKQLRSQGTYRANDIQQIIAAERQENATLPGILATLAKGHRVLMESIDATNTPMSAIIGTPMISTMGAPDTPDPHGFDVWAEPLPSNAREGSLYGIKGLPGQSTHRTMADPTVLQQRLTQAASEIQRLLQQLEKTNPNATEAEQKAFVTAAIPSTLRQQAVGALQSNGGIALGSLWANPHDPYLSRAIAIVEDWQSAQ